MFSIEFRTCDTVWAYHYSFSNAEWWVQTCKKLLLQFTVVILQMKSLECMMYHEGRKCMSHQAISTNMLEALHFWFWMMLSERSLALSQEKCQLISKGGRKHLWPPNRYWLWQETLLACRNLFHAWWRCMFLTWYPRSDTFENSIDGAAQAVFGAVQSQVGTVTSHIRDGQSALNHPYSFWNAATCTICARVLENDFF